MDVGIFCNEARAKVLITYGQGQKEVFTTQETPINVEHIDIDNADKSFCIGKKCYRFWGENVYKDGRRELTFEHYVLAHSATYQPNESLQNNGAWLFADGVMQNGAGYYFFQGTFGDVTYSRQIEVLLEVGVRRGASSGDCNCHACQIKIKNKDERLIYNKIIASPCDIKVDCGDCPPGYIKCPSPRYPGYCCLPCKGTADKINNLANKIK